MLKDVFSTPSKMTVFNSSNNERALEITFLIHDLTNPTRLSKKPVHRGAF